MTEILLWAMFLVTFMLSTVLYARVDWHDWGMVGVCIFLGGAAVLLGRGLLIRYGYYTHPDIVVIWRVMVLVGAPISIVGNTIGFFRDRPPMKQLIRRFSALLIVTFAVALVVSIAR